MFIKFGSKEHLSSLMGSGEMFFNPCEYFRNLEDEERKKGIGDANDGGICSKFENALVVDTAKNCYTLSGQSLSVITAPSLHTPIFCLRKTEQKHISFEYRKKLRDQFPSHTHALVIEDEHSFLESIRFSFHNKAFAHKIFYQDDWYIDYIEFIRSGSSDIFFYPTKNHRNSYYMALNYISHNGEKTILTIDNSNFYKTMFCKSLFFKDQEEYRIVLPYEQISSGEKYYIEPLDSYLCTIDDLVFG